jgi:hypothetical protein
MIRTRPRRFRRAYHPTRDNIIWCSFSVALSSLYDPGTGTFSFPVRNWHFTRSQKALRTVTDSSSRPKQQENRVRKHKVISWTFGTGSNWRMDTNSITNIFIQYCSPSTVTVFNQGKLNNHYSITNERRNAYNILVRKSREKISPERPRHRRKDVLICCHV